MTGPSKFVRSMLALTVLAAFSGQVCADDEKPADKAVAHTPAELKAMEQLRNNGATVMEVAKNDTRLDVAFHLTDGEVKDEHLTPLANTPLLWSLNLRGTAITNAGLKNLADAKNLTRLHLEQTKVDDAGLAHLQKLEGLEYLNLYGTAVTDAGLKNLEGLKNLQRLYLWQTKVTDAGVKSLQSKLPKLEIIRGLSLTPPKKEEPKKPEPKKPAPKKEEPKKPEPKKEAPKKAEPKKDAKPAKK